MSKGLVGDDVHREGQGLQRRTLLSNQPRVASSEEVEFLNVSVAPFCFVDLLDGATCVCDKLSAVVSTLEQRL